MKHSHDNLGFKKEFIVANPEEFSFKIGSSVATALSGFVAGVVFTTIFWASVYYILESVMLSILR